MAKRMTESMILAIFVAIGVVVFVAGILNLFRLTKNEMQRRENV